MGARAVNRSVGSPKLEGPQGPGRRGGRSNSEVGAIPPRIDHGARKALWLRVEEQCPSRGGSHVRDLRPTHYVDRVPNPIPPSAGKVGAIDDSVELGDRGCPGVG